MPEANRPSALDPQQMLEDAIWIHSLATAIARNPAEADDLSQATHLALLERPPEGIQNPKAWLFGLMRNLAGKLRMKEGMQARLAFRPQGLDAEENPEEVVDRAETRKAVLEAVLSLRDPYRSAILMRYYDGYSSAEIARRLELAPATVRSHVRRGLELLREGMKRRVGPGWRASCLALMGRPPIRPGIDASDSPTIPSAPLKTSWILSLGVIGILAMALVLFGNPFDMPVIETNLATGANSNSFSEVAPETQANGQEAARIAVSETTPWSIRVMDSETRVPIPEVRFLKETSGNRIKSKYLEGMGIHNLYFESAPSNNITVQADGYSSNTTVFPATLEPKTESIEIFLSKWSETVISIHPKDMDLVPEAVSQLRAVAWRVDHPAPGYGTGKGEYFEASLESDGTFRFTNQLQAGLPYRVAFIGGGFTSPTIWSGVIGGEDHWTTVSPIALQRVCAIEVIPTGNNDSLDLSHRSPRIEQEFVTWEANRGNIIRQDDPRYFIAGRDRIANLNPEFICLVTYDKFEIPPEIRFNLTLPGFPEIKKKISTALTEGFFTRLSVPLPARTHRVRDFNCQFIGTCSKFLDNATRFKSWIWLASANSDTDGDEPLYFVPVKEVQGGFKHVVGLPEGTYYAILLLPTLGEVGMITSEIQENVLLGAAQATITFDLREYGSTELLPVLGPEYSNEETAQISPNFGADFSGFLSMEFQRLGSDDTFSVSWETGPYLLSPLTPGTYKGRLADGFWNNWRNSSLPWIEFEITANQSTQTEIPLPSFKPRQ